MFKKIIEKLKNNKKTSICIFLCIFVFATIIGYFISNGTFAVVTENDDTVEIYCPSTAAVGQTIQCEVKSNIATMTVLGIKANYNVTNGLVYNTFTKEATNWNLELANSENGFMVGNLSGLTGEKVVGTLSYTIPSNAQSNAIYTIKLEKIQFSDDDYVDHDINAVSASIRVLSDINTLSGITLSTGNLNQEFSSSLNNYTVNVDSSNITINATKSDEKSTITGAGNLELHYGTNNVDIVVTSESGKTNTYTLSIFRTCDFSTTKYIYDTNKSYLYTKTDTDKNVIISNIQIPNELSSDVSNSKLMINYNTENLISMDIINFSINNYTISDNKLYVGNNITYEDFINNFEVNGVTLKVLNKDGIQINSGMIDDGYKLQVYRNTILLETYDIVSGRLNFSDNINVDINSKVIKRRSSNTNYSSIVNEISTNGTISIKNGENKSILSVNDKVKTGDILNISMPTGYVEYTVSVLGDVTGNKTESGIIIGDGEIDLGDVALLYKYLKGKVTFTDCQITAGDILNDSSIKINDVARLYRYLKGKHSTLEVE